MLFKCCVTCLKRDALHKPSAFVSVFSILLMYCSSRYARLNGGIYFSISQQKERVPFPPPRPLNDLQLKTMRKDKF